MGISADLYATVRGRADVESDLSSGEEGELVCNPRADLLVAKGLPENTEIVRMRQSYIAGYDQSIAAVAPLVALPTTAAGAGTVSMFNQEQDNGKIYIIDSLWCIVNSAIGAATPLTMIAMLGVGKFSNATAITNDVTPRGLAGQAYRGTAVIDLAYAGTLVDDNWQPVGSSLNAIAANLGSVVDVPCRGIFVVPPGHAFHFGVVANTATATSVKFGVRWHEVQLPVG